MGTMKLLHNRLKFVATSEGNLSAIQQLGIYLLALSVTGLILYSYIL